MDEIILKLKDSIKKIENKSIRVYFIVQDTKGNARGSIRYIYQICKALKDAGYNAIILHEKSDYSGVSSWLGEEFAGIEHKAIEGQKLEISPEDLIVIPELLAYVLPQIKSIPAGRIILAQCYDQILDTMNPGENWFTLNATKCITTSEKQKEIISQYMKGISFDILSPVISKSFTKQTLPPNPIIGVHCRDSRDSLKIIKGFYLRNPQYRWVTFRDLRGLSEEEFATAVRDCFLCVWVDTTSGFGTFPLECMKTGVPVIGVKPNLIPEWMSEGNGLWIQNPNDMVKHITEFLQAWVEDNVSEELYVNMEKTAAQYSDLDKFKTDVLTLFDNYNQARAVGFKEQLDKLEKQKLENAKQ